MLVLTRLVNESVVIELPTGPITITVIEVRGDKARLGFTAPRDVPIHRTEVAARIKESMAAVN